MPESIESYAARLASAAGPDGRPVLEADGMTSWDVFPFEADGLRAKAIQPLADQEPGRMGDDPATCSLGGCPGEGSAGWSVVWSGDRWQVKVPPPSGLPMILVLEPLAHLDLTDLSDELAAEMGRLTVALAGAIETLPTVARCHVQRIGDGAVHLHLWFLGRPARLPQFRGSYNVVWDDIAPPIPVEVRDENAVFVVDRLIESAGGTRADG